MKAPFVVVALVAALVSGGAMAEEKAPAAAAPAKAAEQPQEVIQELPAAVRADMEKLVEAAVQLASGPLQTADTFPPYGVLMKNDGKFDSVIWKQPNPPVATELFRQITLAITSEARKPEVKAAVTVAPSAVPTTDGKTQVTGIRAEVDHRKGWPRIVFIPFTRESGKLVLGTPVYLPGTNAFFAQRDAIAELKAADGAVKPAAKAAAKPAAKKAPAKAAAKPAATKP